MSQSRNGFWLLMTPWNWNWVSVPWTLVSETYPSESACAIDMVVCTPLPSGGGGGGLVQYENE